MNARSFMRVSLLFICAVVFCAPSLVSAATYVTEDVTTDTEWTTSGSPYVVAFPDNDADFQNLLTIHAGVTLTIDPGVVVKFKDYNGAAIVGTLHAEGTVESPIIFTSLEDDTVEGDTNGDGAATSPTDKQWLYLEFDNGSYGTVTNATVRYGGAPRRYVFNTGIENYGGTLILDHLTLTHNGYDGLGQYGGHTTLTNSTISNHTIGIRMEGGQLDISNTRIHDNSWKGIDHSWSGALSIAQSEIDHNGVGITVTGHGSIAVTGSSIHDNELGIDNGTQVTGYDENDNPIVTDPGISIDARNNWWGSASGPYDESGNPSGAGNGTSGDVVYAPWLTSNPFAPATCTPSVTCVSNVLFLPGIEGSRLYEGTGCGKTAEEKLWEPYESAWSAIRGAGDRKVGDLSLDSTGSSVCSDIYVKDGDVVDAVSSANIYKSFLEQMNGLKADATIKDWKPVAYDWRLSLTDLLSNGVERHGKIFYEEASSTPYIEQTLRALAASSKTGKVTIVAHSNGGLVAKALLAKLGNTEAAKLVDKMIMVGVPQTGAPADIGVTLVGYDAGLSGLSGFFTIVSNAAARALAQNSPMAYHLLPSESYFESLSILDVAHPVISFSGAGYTKEIAAYGNTIINASAMDDFLLAKEGGRVKPQASDLRSAEILSPALIAYANNQHALLDPWAPPAGIEVDQIAGWGVDTVGGVDFYSLPKGSVLSERAYRPTMIEDGDGTVPVPSALMMASSTSVKRYWLNLVNSSIKHASLFESSDLRTFLDSVLTNSSVIPPITISTQAPISSNPKKLTFFLHSPLTLQLTDSSGHVTGLATDGSVTQDIPGSVYSEFGEVKYVTVPDGSAYHLTMHGQATGTFSLETQETSGGVVTASSTIAGVPTTATTIVTMDVLPDASTPSPMNIDKNGDGTTDVVIVPKLGGTVVFDTTPPELKITFSTTTNALAFIGTDDTGTPTVTSTTTYPALKKNEKAYKGTATTTVTARDAAGNTTKLVYTEQLPSPVLRDTITLVALVYNGATTTLSNSRVSYKWRAGRDATYKLFAAFIRTPSTLVESHYRPKKNKTVIMTKPQDLDDSDEDDDADVRPTKVIVSGVVVPYIQTKRGALITTY